MTSIIFVFTVPDSAGSPGVVPWAVWSRQLPRMVVATLNGDADRGLRFFPFLGVQDGKRTFLEPRDQLPPSVLARIHGQSEPPTALVDGTLNEHLLTLRVHSGDGDREILETEMPFDGSNPFIAVRRSAFELQGALAIAGDLRRTPELGPDGLRSFFLAKDALLALEASLLVPGIEHCITLAERAWREDPSHPEMRSLVLDTARHLVRHGVGEALVVEALRSMIGATEEPDIGLVDVAELFELCRATDDAVDLRARLASACPEHTDNLLAAGQSLFRMGATDRVHRLLSDAVATGNDDPRVLAQLAACEDLRGDRSERDRIVEDLAADDRVPLAPGTARFVAAWLTEHGDLERASGLLDRAIDNNRSNAGLWLERGRAHLGLEQLATAREDLQHCLTLRPDETTRQEARRLLQLAREDSALPAILGIERLLGDADLDPALEAARRFAKDRKSLAEAHLMLGLVRQRRGEYLKAIRCYRRALQRKPDCADAHNRLGILLVEKGKAGEGYTHLRHAVDLASDDASCWLHFAQGAHEVGEIDEAREALRRAEALGTHDALCAQIRERLEL